jgi:hypothetical protein
MTEVLYPVLSKEALHTGPAGYGLLVGAAGPVAWPGSSSAYRW